MKRFAPTTLSLTLILLISSTAFAGHITGGRAAGNIPVGRAAGHIPVGRSASFSNPATNRDLTKFGIETAISNTFVGLFRMLLESGALL